MEERLRNLRKSMKNSTFKELQFTDSLRETILGKINAANESNEEILLAIMQLLVQEKTGFELMKQLRSRGIQKFEENEGHLYTLLHRLEQANCLQARWDLTQAKYYQLTNRGKKQLQKVETKKTSPRLLVKELLEG